MGTKSRIYPIDTIYSELDMLCGRAPQHMYTSMHVDQDMVRVLCTNILAGPAPVIPVAPGTHPDTGVTGQWPLLRINV